jgi:hypothetical protein
VTSIYKLGSLFITPVLILLHISLHFPCVCTQPCVAIVTCISNIIFIVQKNEYVNKYVGTDVMCDKDRYIVASVLSPVVISQGIKAFSCLCHEVCVSVTELSTVTIQIRREIHFSISCVSADEPGQRSRCTDWPTDGSEFESRYSRIFISPCRPGWLWGPPNGYRGSFPGCKLAGA